MMINTSVFCDEIFKMKSRYQHVGENNLIKIFIRNLRLYAESETNSSIFRLVKRLKFVLNRLLGTAYCPIFNDQPDHVNNFCPTILKKITKIPTKHSRILTLNISSSQ
jgi:hypothetical protein